MSETKVVTAVKPAVRRLMVGLGNVGPEFHRTRHNVGFAVCKLFVDEYLPKMENPGERGVWKYSKPNKCHLLQSGITFSQETSLGYDLVDKVSERAILKTKTNGVPFNSIKLSVTLPTTYMNNSGQSVVLFTKNNYFRMKKPAAKNLMDEVIIVHDDINIPFGEIRFSPKGGDGGQNGVKSIIKCLATENFPRLRIGIGAPHGDVPIKASPQYVVGRWDVSQLRQLPYILHFACEGLRVYLHRGVNSAASCCNFKNCEEAYKKLVPHRDFSRFDVDDTMTKC